MSYMFRSATVFRQDLRSWNVCKNTYNENFFDTFTETPLYLFKPYFDDTSKCNGGNPESYTEKSYTELYPNIEERFTILYPEEYNEDNKERNKKHKVQITFFK